MLDNPKINRFSERISFSADRRLWWQSKPTISDVAARAGVSKGAVSFALNGRPGVSPDTRDRILRAADELGFVRNATARALSSRRSTASA